MDPDEAMNTHGVGLLRVIFEGLKDWFPPWARRSAPSNDDGELPVAVATLLAAIIRAGTRQHPQTLAAAARTLAQLFRIDADDAWALMGAARERVSNVSSYSPVISVLNRHWPARQKKRFTRQMWRVARADGRISYHQDRLVRSVATQLDVPDIDVLRTRERWFL